jgi:BlaI family transcriptional regulator, penicillinase repressor
VTAPSTNSFVDITKNVVYTPAMSEPSRLPTDAELEILGVLWDRGPSTVRAVHEVLNARKPVGYTTALKLLQIMHEKGLVRRDERTRTHVYEAVVARQQTQSALVNDLVERAFGGSASALVLGALMAKPASADEMAEIRRLLDELEQKK